MPGRKASACHARCTARISGIARPDASRTLSVTLYRQHALGNPRPAATPRLMTDAGQPRQRERRSAGSARR